jgi:hypothetical protein
MVRHRRLPLGRMWLPVPSALVYAGAWVARAVLRLPRVRRRMPADCPLDGKRVGALVTGAARALLWSGSYVLLDVKVEEKEERVGVRVRVV